MTIPKNTVTGFAALLLLIVLGLSLRHAAARYYHCKAIALQQEGLHDQAIKAYARSIAFESSDSLAHYNLAAAYAAQRDFDAAIREYAAALAIDPHNRSATLGMAEAYAATGRYEEALELFKPVLPESREGDGVRETAGRIALQYATECLNLAIDAYTAQEKPKAYALLEKGLTVKPDLGLLHYTLGFFLYQDGRLDRAEESIRASLEYTPDLWLALRLWGDLEFARGAFRRAVQRYKSALAVFEKDAALYNDLGLAYMQLEEYGEAVRCLKEAVALDPANDNYQYSLASLYRDHQDLNDALARYEVLVARRPDYPHVHNDMGDIYRQLSKPQEALAHYALEKENCVRRLGRSPSDVQALGSLAHALRGLKEFARAEEAARRALATDPQCRTAYLVLADIMEETGRYAESLEMLKKAKSLPGVTNYIERSESRVNRSFDVFLGTVRQSYADTVYLRNGRTIQGKIVSEDAGKVVLMLALGSGAGSLTFRREEVLRIERAVDPYTPGGRQKP